MKEREDDKDKKTSRMKNKGRKKKNAVGLEMEF